MLSFVLLLACSSPAPVEAECPEQTCPDCPSSNLEAWEMAILSPTVDRLREGIKPLGEHGFGICKGDGCSKWLGTDAGALSTGKHYVRAELQTPPVGSPWKVNFEVACADSEGNPTQTHNYSYDLVYTGEKQGYQLDPLWVIQSPHPGGVRDCTYTLTPIRPDGETLAPLKGAYRTPAPEG